MMRLANTFTCCRNYLALLLVFTVLGKVNMIAQEEQSPVPAGMPIIIMEFPLARNKLHFSINLKTIVTIGTYEGLYDARLHERWGFLIANPFLPTAQFAKKHLVHLNQVENYEIELRIRYVRGSQKSETGPHIWSRQSRQ